MKKALHAVSAILFCAAHPAMATEYCPSDVWLRSKCVPETVVAEAMHMPGARSYVDIMREMYTTAATATGSRNDTLEMPSAPDKTAAAVIFPSWPGIFGAQEIEPARKRQLTLFTEYCEGQGGTLKRVTLNGFSAEHITAFCLDKAGKALGGVMVSLPKPDGFIQSKRNFQVNYFGTENAQRVVDLWTAPRIGDKTHQGMVIEVKLPIVKVQTARNGERWFEADTLLPKGL